MKKLAFMLFVAVLSIAFVACGDSEDSQTQSSIDSSESTQKSTQDSQDSIQSNAQSSESTQSLAWEKADCDFLMKLWGITKERCDMMDMPPDITIIESENINQDYQHFLIDDESLGIREFLWLKTT